MTQVFKLPGHVQKFAFQMFIINLDIWGSYISSSNTQIDRMPYLMRKEACEKVELARITLERCVAIMKNEKGKLFETVRYRTIVLLNYFEKISKYLTMRVKKPNTGKKNVLKKEEYLIKSNDKLREEIKYTSDNDDFENEKFDSIDLRQPQYESNPLSEETKTDHVRDNFVPLNDDSSIDNVAEPNIQIEHSFFKTYLDPSPEIKGYLLNIRCGHNGNFNILEKNMYEKHLAKAGFMTLKSRNIMGRYSDEFM